MKGEVLGGSVYGKMIASEGGVSEEGDKSGHA